MMLFLVDVADNKRMNKVSSRGFGLGYIGSTIPFLLSISIILLSQQGIIPISSTFASRIAFLITCLWWAVFSVPIIRNVGQVYFIQRDTKPVLQSFVRLFETMKHIKQYKHLSIFFDRLLFLHRWSRNNYFDVYCIWD